VEALPLSCHSEYTNAYIVAKSGLTHLIAGNCTDEWGFGFKALRKAVLLRPFEESYEEVLRNNRGQRIHNFSEVQIFSAVKNVDINFKISI
jgi:hypothetical protein